MFFFPRFRGNGVDVFALFLRRVAGDLRVAPFDRPQVVRADPRRVEVALLARVHGHVGRGVFHDRTGQAYLAEAIKL